MPGIHQETVKHIIRNDHGMRKVIFKWVPHVLKSSQKFFRSKFPESYLISWKAAQAEVGQMCALEKKSGCPWIIFGRPRGLALTFRGLLEFGA
jgi:hypothetical protein